MMWPETGSGFEAEACSPAGTAQREWALIQLLGRSRVGRLAVWAILGVLALSVAVSVLSALLARH